MKSFGIFDVIGPIIIGPSSSHTAGAVRIALVARRIAGIGYNHVNFFLHGSFAATYKGHGTDKALIGGILGFEPSDERIKNSILHAKEAGITYNFIPIELEDAHSNTVKIEFNYPDGSCFYVIGSSIGGANIEITNINGTSVTFTGENPTLLFRYKEQKGMIAYISNALYAKGHNIHLMLTIKEDDEVLLVVELNESLDSDLFEAIKNGKSFLFSKYIYVPTSKTSKSND
ncbi:MAG: L-serine dehydratase, iron-sulfur-dependent, beta subunit [Petrotoga mobilis]|nr:MAG: L-serine dehydratase, iron-sulfur-dependent, beta subunit [Petrotoga mobilis]